MLKRVFEMLTIFMVLLLCVGPSFAGDDSLNEMISFKFKGAGNFSNTLSSTTPYAGVTSYATYDQVQIPCTAHGYLAGSLIYLSGSTGTRAYLNGLWRIDTVASDSFTIRVPDGTYVSGTTPNGTETARVAFPFEDSDFVFLGFDIHLSAVGGAAESLIVQRDANAGAEFDVVYYTVSMLTLENIVSYYDPPIRCDEDDLIVATYTNTNSVTWGITFYVKKRY